MKISELPTAERVTNDDFLPLVQNGETKKANRGKILEGVPDGLTQENGFLHLIANGEKVGEGVELPKTTVDSELSAESENPVQNKAVKAALDKKLDDSAGSVKSENLADGCIAWKHIGEGQVTTPAIADNSINHLKILNKNITEEKLSDDVKKKINSGTKQINKVTLDETTQGAQSIKITQDNLGNTFSLSNAVITAHLNIDISKMTGNSYQIRIVANKGRFPAYTSEKALGNYYGNNLIKAIKEFQRRTNLEPDGCTGPLTLAMLEKYGFKK